MLIQIKDIGLFWAAVFDVFFGVTIFLKNKNSELNLSFSLLALSVGCWTLSLLIFGFLPTIDSSFLCMGIVIVSAGFIASSFLHFSLVFTNHTQRLSPFFSILLYLPNLMVFGGTLKQGILVREIIFHPWGKESVLGPGYYLYGLYFSLFMTIGFILLLRQFLSSTGKVKIQTVYILLGTLISAIFGSIFDLLFLFLGNFKYIWLGPYASFFLIAFTAYAITKHELMDIRVVIGRGLAYGISGGLLLISFIGLNALQMPLWLVMASNALLALFWAWGAHRLREIIQTPLEEKWITGWYNSDQLINRIAKSLVSVYEKEEVFKVIADQLKESIKIKSVEVVLEKPETEYADVIQTKSGLVIPMSSSDGIEGILILGPKISEDPYSEKDLTVFRTIRSQARPVLDRIRLFEEMLNAQKQLLMADKLSSMGKVAAGLAHEIKNPLTAIKGMTQALERNPGDQETIKDFNAIIPKEVDRLTRLVEGLSNLGKTPKFQITKVNINTLLENNLKLFESRCRKQSINIIKEFGTLPEIETDGERLTQVFTNLILNAIQAMPDGGKLEIGTRNTELGMEIEISDTGQGIPEDKIKDIFEPFFTTKEEGTGLGLAITHKIIKDLGGEITVESKVGEGTRFKILSPI